MRNRRVIALGLAALAASLMVVPVSADASSTSSVAVATGTVTGPTGAAASGAPVDLYAWPSDAVLKAMKPGQMVPTTLLATATTNRYGHYTLMVPAASLKAAVADSGYANLEIDSASGIWFLSYQPGAASAHTATVNLAAKKGGKWACGREPERQPFKGAAYIKVGWWLVKNLKPAKTVVGQGYIVPSKKTRGDWVSFKYVQGSNQSQTSTLGVGLSVYGVSAGYSTTGTKKSTASGVQGYRRQTRNTLFETLFTSAIYRADCLGTSFQTAPPRSKQHGYCPTTFTKDGLTYYVAKCLWHVASTGWFGGGPMRHPESAFKTPAKYCAIEYQGDFFGNDTGSAVEWTTKFQIGAAAGIKGVNLKTSFGTTTQTGYDKNAKMHYQFRQRGYICGTNNRPTKAAILVARGTRS
jgi:hypothetical protein